MLGLLAALLLGVLILFGFGQALGARGQAQRAADLAAISAAQVMRRNFARVFEPAFLERGLPNPRHLSNAAYLSLARAAARRGASRNGIAPARVDVAFPGSGFAPTRATVKVRDETEVRLSAEGGERVEVRARATAEIAPRAGASMPEQASGGGYSGPLAYRQGKPTPHLFPPCGSAFRLPRASGSSSCAAPPNPRLEQTPRHSTNVKRDTRLYGEAAARVRKTPAGRSRKGTRQLP
jgi:hypothetical protein